MQTLKIDGHALEYRWLEPRSAWPAADAPVLVLLHEGLGCVDMWRDFPQRLADACGCRALLYSRYGYGGSDPLAEPRRPDYLHHEACVVLPRVLDALRVTRPVLFGHSDGASIALLYAGACAPPAAGLIVLAPHVMVEEVTIAGVREARKVFDTTDLPQRLARWHRDARAAFHGWNDIWLDPAFRDWNIESCLPRIACPVLAIQGEDDEYATMAQLDRIAAGAPRVELLKLSGCGHSPHRDRPDDVLAAAARFVAGLRVGA